MISRLEALLNNEIYETSTIDLRAPVHTPAVCSFGVMCDILAFIIVNFYKGNYC